MIRPYSDEDYQEAQKEGLDLEDWYDYKNFFKLEEYANYCEDWWRE